MRKKIVLILILVVAFSAMATAAVQTVASTDFGAATLEVAAVADLDAVTTGPASWSASKQFGFSAIRLDAGGTDAGYYIDVKGVLPTPGDNVALAMDSALDFSSLQTIVNFDYTHARTAGVGAKVLTVEGLDSLGARVFAITVDQYGMAVTPTYWDGSAMQTYTGVTVDRGSNGANAYLPAKMTTFAITLEGTTVTYVADGVTVVGTTTSTDFKTLEFQFDTAATWNGFWMDNIVVQADDGLGGNNPPTGEISGSNDSTIYYDEGVVWDATSADMEDDPIDLTYAWTVIDSTSAAGTAPIVFLSGSEAQEDPNIAVDMTGITPAEAAGDYTLQLVITDTGSLDVTLSAVLTVLDNLAPVVDAGSDSFVFPLSASKVLEGVVTDDGYPKPAVLTTEWTVEPGAPGTVTFTPDVYDPAASVSFDAEGEYTLTLIASDGEIVGLDSVLITVWPTEYAVVTIQPTDDATIQSSKPDWNLGIRDNMWVNGDGPHQLSFLKFDLAAEAPGAIKLASLSMKTIAANSGFTQTRARPVLYGPSGEWFEGNGNDQVGIPDTTGVGITYNTNDLVWDPAVLDEVTGLPIPTNTWFDFDVLGLVREADGKATIGLDAPDMTQGWRGWFPKEKADAKPILTITYDPNEAYAPIPVDTLIFDVHLYTTLSWEKGATGFATNMVYISKDPDPFTNPEASIVVNSGPADPNRLVADLSADFPDGLDVSTVYYWGVDNGSSTSDVWSFYTMSYNPRIPALIAPEDGAGNVVIPISFEYRPGDDATQHDLQIDADVISDIPADEYLYDPAAEALQLSLETEYTWYISGTDGFDTWDSEARTFTTANYAVVADFNDPCSPLEFVGGTRDENVYAGDNGIASMRIDYTAGTTTASRTFGVPQDWTATTNRAALYLAYKGWDTNAAGSLEVELYDGTNTESVSLVDDGSVIDDPNPLINDSFRTFDGWDIDLADFTVVDLSNIEKISINVVSAGSGKVFIDDVRVYAPRCLSGMVPGDIAGGDCTADANDLNELAANWLTQAETVVAQTPSTDGLLAHWDFEGDYVDTVSGWTLTMDGSPSLTADVPAVGGTQALDCSSLGKLVELDGGAISSKLASVSDSLTVSFWAKCNITVDPATGLIDQYYVFWFNDLSTNAPGGNTQNNVYVQLPRKYGDISFGGGGGYLAAHVESAIYEAGSPWSHFAIVLDAASDTKKVYVNGELRAVNNEVNLLDGTLATNLNIGGDNNVNYWHGLLDEFRIYDRALAQGEIVSLANQTSVEQGLLIDSDIIEDGVVNLADFAEIAKIWMSDEVVWP